jgi:hypothetical protein
MKAITNKDLCLISVIVEEFEHHRLPRLFHMREKVIAGLALDDGEFEYLYRLIHETCYEKPLMVGHPEIEQFFLHVCHLYRDISEMALGNEQIIRAA